MLHFSNKEQGCRGVTQKTRGHGYIRVLLLTICTTLPALRENMLSATKTPNCAAEFLLLLVLLARAPPANSTAGTLCTSLQHFANQVYTADDAAQLRSQSKFLSTKLDETVWTSPTVLHSIATAQAKSVNTPLPPTVYSSAEIPELVYAIICNSSTAAPADADSRLMQYVLAGAIVQGQYVAAAADTSVYGFPACLAAEDPQLALATDNTITCACTRAKCKPVRCNSNLQYVVALVFVVIQALSFRGTFYRPTTDCETKIEEKKT